MSTVSIAAFVKRNWPRARSLDRVRLVSWLQWFINHNALAVATDGARIVAVGMVRPVETEAEARTPYTWNPWGRSLFCELAVSRHPLGLGVVWAEMLARFPQRHFLFHRTGKGSDRLRHYDTARLTRLILKGA